MKSVRIGICGLGTVGSGVFQVLMRNQASINARAGCALEIGVVGARRDNPNCPTGEVNVVRDVFEVARDPSIDIVVELIGGTTIAKTLVLEAIQHGKHVVTANKALIAEQGDDIFAAAKAQGVTVAFEAAVAGGIPIIKSIREGLAANHIDWLAGIINGTGNFILSEMRDKGRAFADVLAEAQALGYAEADPTFDVEGIDAAHKLVILASLAFGIPLQFEKVYTEGISRITAQDVAYAEELGYRIKHLGIAKRRGQGVEMRVHPTLIPEKQLLANVDGVMNAVAVKGDAVGPSLFYGAGAGAEPTASAVISDLVDLARTLSADPEHRVPHLGFRADCLNELPIIPIESIETVYFVRMQALDQTGVLSSIAQLLSDAGVSIEALVQKEPLEGQNQVPIILLTNTVSEKRLMDALDKIQALPTVAGDVIHIRVESLE